MSAGVDLDSVKSPWMKNASPSGSPKSSIRFLYLASSSITAGKAAGKRPGCWWGGIALFSSKNGWAIYKDGKVVEMISCRLLGNTKIIVCLLEDGFDLCLRDGNAFLEQRVN